MTLSKSRILVVDDTPSTRQATVLVMQAFGFETDEAQNGLEALEKINSGAYEVAFVDYNMPSMNGFELTAKIRELEKKTGTRMPVIGLTASDMPDIQGKCMQAGMDDYLYKGCSMDELVDMVRKWVSIEFELHRYY